jgi:hypothetical protein
MGQATNSGVGEGALDRFGNLPLDPKTVYLGKTKYILRALGATLGWALGVYWWVIVLRSSTGSNTHIEASIFGIIGIIAVIVLVVIAAIIWTQHNLAIARTGRRGEISRYLSPKFERDYFGRALTLPSRPILIRFEVINLRTETNRKIYFRGVAPAEPGRRASGLEASGDVA